MSATQHVQATFGSVRRGWTPVDEPPQGPGSSRRFPAAMTLTPAKARVITAAGLAGPDPGQAILAVSLNRRFRIAPCPRTGSADREVPKFGFVCLGPGAGRLEFDEEETVLLVKVDVAHADDPFLGVPAALWQSRPTIVHRSDPVIGELASALADNLADPRGDSLEYGVMLTCSLLVRAGFLLRTAVTEDPQRRPTRLPRYKLRRLQEHIDGNLGQSITLDCLAAVAGVSRFHFARAFKAETGLSPMRYVMNRRLERCRHLIEDTELPLVEIALDCGFASQAHMTTVFRRLTGTTPGRFRRLVAEPSHFRVASRRPASSAP